MIKFARSPVASTSSTVATARFTDTSSNEARKVPIRGGTGVDPFLAKGIPIANLGTGYFAPESEKELTSRQKIADHVRPDSDFFAWFVSDHYDEVLNPNGFEFTIRPGIRLR